jgi:hypothetical protein
MPDLAGRNEAPQLAGNSFMNVARDRRAISSSSSVGVPPAAGACRRRDTRGRRVHPQANGAQAGATALTATSAAPIGSVAAGDADRRGRGAADGGAGAPRADVRARPARPVSRRPGAAARRQRPARHRRRHGLRAGHRRMLRSRDPGDWLMARRNYQGWATARSRGHAGQRQDLQLMGVGHERRAGQRPSPLVRRRLT